ncbi:MAG: hypothetical protein JWM08_3401 [Candidatus Angelobacter sp.]|nr:hypothetical protein [Candidatus Angelobacter sp.]
MRATVLFEDGFCSSYPDASGSSFVAGALLATRFHADISRRSNRDSTAAETAMPLGYQCDRKADSRACDHRRHHCYRSCNRKKLLESSAPRPEDLDPLIRRDAFEVLNEFRSVIEVVGSQLRNAARHDTRAVYRGLAAIVELP